MVHLDLNIISIAISSIEQNSMKIASKPLKDLNIKVFQIKESYSRVNESKQQLNSFIIYNLDSIVRVNDNWQSIILKKKRKFVWKKMRRRGSISRRLSVPLQSDPAEL